MGGRAEMGRRARRIVCAWWLIGICVSRKLKAPLRHCARGPFSAYNSYFKFDDNFKFDENFKFDIKFNSTFKTGFCVNPRRFLRWG